MYLFVANSQTMAEYVNKLVGNLPKTHYGTIDLMLDGGLFNCSHLAGALSFLKEMERKQLIIVDRIAACSIGSLVALLYFGDVLNEITNLYDIVNYDFKTNHSLRALLDLKTHLSLVLPSDILSKVNHKLFISFHNLKKQKKIIKSTFTNPDELIDAVIKSCFFPFIINGNMLLKSTYFDGITPYMFKPNAAKKILYIDLFGIDKLGCLLNVKNEKTNYHRILSGMLDAHDFFIKEQNTSMCSYVDEWSYLLKGRYLCKKAFEFALFNVLRFLQLFCNLHLSPCIKQSLIYKLSSKISRDVFVVLLETYCI
jgi:hypothetical protein